MCWPKQVSVGNYNFGAVGVTGTLEEWPSLPFHLWRSSLHILESLKLILVVLMGRVCCDKKLSCVWLNEEKEERIKDWIE